MMLAVLLAAQAFAAAAQTEPVAALTPPAPSVHAQPALTDAVIRQAVRETVAETPPPAPPVNPPAGAFRASSVEARLSAAFEQAKVPDCLHADTLKLQPAHIGPVNVVGPYSLPWVIAAVVRGKCR